jgi:hypothetical protein
MQNEKKGFGYVYQNVMRDKKLTPEAKAIYAYLASFAGNNEMCYPGTSLMMDELLMSKERFYKHMNLLVEQGIVIKQQEMDGTKFSKNTYTINSFPRFPTTEFPTTEIEYTGFPTTENTTTKRNSSKTNSSNSNSKERTPRTPKHKHGEYKHVSLTDYEKERLISEYGHDMFDKCIAKLDEYIEMKGYKATNHNLCIRKWVIKAVQEDDAKKGGKQTYGEAYDTGSCYSTDYYKQFKA